MSRSASARHWHARRSMQLTDLSRDGDRSRKPTRRSTYARRTTCAHLRSSQNIKDEPPLLERRRAHRARASRHRFAGCSQCLNLRVALGCSTRRAAGRSNEHQQLKADADQRVRPRRALQQRRKHHDSRRIISQNCCGLKTGTRKTELIAVLRWRRAFPWRRPALPRGPGPII